MKTAVIIPLYNGLPWIERTIQSVLAQTSSPAEIVVIDDGSTDGGLEVLRKYPNLRLLSNPLKGSNPARNFGLSQTQAPYVAMLDQDDIWHPAHLALLEELLDQHPTAAAAIADVEYFQAPSEPIFDPTAATPSVYDPWASFPVNRVSTPSQALMRRDALMATGGWCVHLVGVADVHAWLRLGAAEPLQHLRRTTVGYRQHAASYSTQLLKKNRHAYLERFIAAGSENLPLRVHHHPEEAVELSRRLDSIRALSSWIRAAEDGTQEEQILRAVSANEAMSVQDAVSVRAILEQVLYFSRIRSLEHFPVAKSFSLFGLIFRCPRQAKKLRRILVRIWWNHVKWHLGIRPAPAPKPRSRSAKIPT